MNCVYLNIWGWLNFNVCYMLIHPNHFTHSIDVSWNNSSWWSTFTKFIAETSQSKFEFIESAIKCFFRRCFITKYSLVKSILFHTLDYFIVTPETNKLIVYFSLFWHRVRFFLFSSIKIITIRHKNMQKKKERQTFRPHMGALFSAINSKINLKFL